MLLEDQRSYKTSQNLIQKENVSVLKESGQKFMN